MASHYTKMDAKGLQAFEDLGAAQLESELPALRELTSENEVPDPKVLARLAKLESIAGDPEKGWRAATAVVDAEPNFAAWLDASRIIDSEALKETTVCKRTLRLAVVSTWTTTPFLPLLRLALARVGIRAELFESGFDQYFVDTLDSASGLFAWDPDYVMLSPESHSLHFPDFSASPELEIDREVARWTRAWDGIREHTTSGIVQHGFVGSSAHPLGHLASTLAGSATSMLRAFSHRFAQAAADARAGYVDVDCLASTIGIDRWHDDRQWYLSKVPYSRVALIELAKHSAAVLAGALGLSKKCLVLDLDNTLWGGVIGDDGLGGIGLGGSGTGEAFVDFQRSIRGMADRGVVLAVCSKNDEQIAKEAFTSHPEMVLRLDHMAAFVADWGAKSEGIKRISSLLNLGLDSFVFVDDNRYEREEVRRALPMVDVLALPEDPAKFRTALERYPYFQTPAFTEEDRNRTSQYRALAAAEAGRLGSTDLEAYQASLQMEACFGSIDELVLPRVVQLINKTNQFNLTTVRRERSEVEELIRRNDIVHYWFRLRDRYADHGLVAVAIAQEKGVALEIDSFLMSCRVLGRKLEHLVIGQLAQEAKRRGLTKLIGTYKPSGRNKLVATLYSEMGFEKLDNAEAETERFIRSVQAPFEPLETIEIRTPEEFRS